MTTYVVRRVLVAIPLVWGIATIVFLLVHLAPGDPALLYIKPGMSQEVIDQIRRNLGLDQPLHIQYVRWLRAMLSGEFGYSTSLFMPVRDVLLTTLPNTLVLSVCALVLAFVAGILLGVVQAVKRTKLLDTVLSVVLLFFYSMPSFWLALMMILAFGYAARNVWELPIWFPASGMVSNDHSLLSPLGRMADRAWHLVLPTLSLALVLTAGIARYMRSSMLDVIGQDFIRTARAKGLPERVVVLKHALRNALLPIVTLLGLYLPILFSGAVFVETVFAWPGMGRALVNAIPQRDYPLLLAGTLFFANAVVLANLLADVLYAVVDPRIRYE